MAEQGTFAAGEDGSHPVPALVHLTMADRERLPVKPVEPSGS
jgi:hypothetical protein